MQGFEAIIQSFASKEFKQPNLKTNAQILIKEGIRIFHNSNMKLLLTAARVDRFPLSKTTLNTL